MICIFLFFRVYNRLGNHVFTSVIPPNLFGPHDNFHLRNGHVVANTIYKTYIARSKLFVKAFIVQRIVFFEPTSNLLFLCVYSNNVLRHNFGMLCCLYPHFTKDYFGPESTISIFFVYRLHICETIKNLRTITWEGLAQLPQSYESRVPKKLLATVFKHVQKQ